MITTLMLVLLLTISWQMLETEPLPFPPENPEMLFGENVEILSAQPWSSRFGNAANVIPEYRMVVTNRGRMYPFPAEFQAWTGDSTFTTESRYPPLGIAWNFAYIGSFEPANPDSSERIWQLDLTSGEWTLFGEPPEFVESYCGMMPYDSFPHEPWVFITGRNAQQHVCNLETGYVSSSLPSDFTNWRIVSRTNNAEYLIIAGDPAQPQDEQQLALYSYNLLSREIVFLGRVAKPSEDEYFSLDSLLDPTLLRLSLRSSSSRDGIALPDSNVMIDLTRQLFQPIPAGGIYRSEPDRLEFRETSEVENRTRCHKKILQIDTMKETSYTLNTGCYPEFSTNEFDYYRLLNADGTQAEVIRVDAMTGAQETIFQGEVENIRWIANDEQFAAFIIDDSGRVDNTPEHYSSGAFAANPQLVLMRLPDQESIYKMDAYADEPGFMRLPEAKNLREDMLAISNESGTILARFDGASVRFDQVDGIPWREFDDNWLLFHPPMTEWVESEHGSATRLYVMNLDSGELTSLVDLEDAVSDYWLNSDIRYLGDDRFEVRIGSQGIQHSIRTPASLYDIVIYQVQVIPTN